tara:strand:- start:1884 stop:2087 length:204 start_codon:yes stop_codon:yes gene_type:complete
MQQYIFLSILVSIIIIACVLPQPLAEGEEFGVVKRSVKLVKITGKCGYRFFKNGFGILKDIVTFNWY